MKSWKRFALAALVLGIAGGAVAAGARHGRAGFWKAGISARIEAALDQIQATPQQRQVVLQAKTEIMDALQAKGKARQNDRGQLAKAFTADRFDAQALQQFADGRAQDVKDLAAVIIPNLQKVHDALTPEQRQKVVQLMHEHHHGHGPQGGFGGQQE
jgi:Spy/CpxP family protein refolding chaperone